ncbi:unnamed protein product [Penicillium salamii]|uniref:Uncharacterized protein n=1 Tax=Penicillium salamii TaxID=1612424 RepID=A0A9W4J8J9_9EURO|nr:unnamed protein product [Penicillium salamii]
MVYVWGSGVEGKKIGWRNLLRLSGRSDQPDKKHGLHVFSLTLSLSSLSLHSVH